MLRRRRPKFVSMMFVVLSLVVAVSSAELALASPPMAPTPSAPPKPAVSRTANPGSPPTATAVPQVTQTPQFSPTPSATATSSATATATPTPTAIPATPTSTRLTPAPTGYFLPAYRGVSQAPGLESGLVRGQVLDFRGLGIKNVPITVSGNGVNIQVSSGTDGEFAIGGLKTATYSLGIVGFPSQSATSIYVATGQIVALDFVESVIAGSGPSTPAGAGSGDAIGGAASPNGPSVVIVVLTPENAVAVRPSVTPSPPSASAGGAIVPRWDTPVQALVSGIVGACVIAAVSIVVVVFRR